MGSTVFAFLITLAVVAGGACKQVDPGPAPAGVLSATLVDGDQAHLPDTEVWLVPSTWDVPHFFTSYDEGQAVKTTTDLDGRFSFAGVADGVWLVGPGRGGRCAPRASVVHVTHGEADLPEFLEAYGNLHIGGHVYGPSGLPFQGADVEAESDRETGLIYTVSDTDGFFSIGPLPPGEYVLRASSMNGQYKFSEQVTAQAGENDLVFHLQLGGSIQGVVRGGSGAPYAGEATITPVDPDHPARFFMSVELEDAGEFHFGEVEPGTYGVFVRTSSGETALRHALVVEPEARASAVELEVAQGARLHVRNVSQESAVTFLVTSQGAAVAWGRIRPGAESTQVVPVGTVETTFYDGTSDSPEVRELTLEPGEEREVVFGEGR